MLLTKIERRLLAYLDQRGPTHRQTIVWDLASPESKIGRIRDEGRRLTGASSSNAESLIVGAWARRLMKVGFVEVIRVDGFYRHHAITPTGRIAARPND